jgi:deoxycytidine triphosphate deaminase
MRLDKSEIARRLKLEEEDQSRLRVVSPQTELEIDDYGLRLHLGDQFLTIESSSSLEPPRTRSFTANEFKIRPSGLVLGQSYESIGLPVDLVGEMHSLSLLNRRGLHVSSAGRIDPGYSGHLIFEIGDSGISPVTIRVGMPIAELVLHSIDPIKFASNARSSQDWNLVVPATDASLSTHFFKAHDAAHLAALSDSLRIAAQAWTIDHETERRLSMVRELERMIRDPSLREQDFQNFFEENDWLLFSHEYIEVKPQIILQLQDGNTLRPDFFLKPITGSLWDILEIKKPMERIVVEKKNRRRVSMAVYEAIAQLRTYASYFDEAVNRHWVNDSHGVNSYKPQLILLIGQRTGIGDPIVERDIRIALSGVRLVTYEELVRIMRHQLLPDRRKPQT